MVVVFDSQINYQFGFFCVNAMTKTMILQQRKSISKGQINILYERNNSLDDWIELTGNCVAAILYKVSIACFPSLPRSIEKLFT
jgi:hypothetical protein